MLSVNTRAGVLSMASFRQEIDKQSFLSRENTTIKESNFADGLSAPAILRDLKEVEQLTIAEAL